MKLKSLYSISTTIRYIGKRMQERLDAFALEEISSQLHTPADLLPRK